jgi:hypothetical protein
MNGSLMVEGMREVGHRGMPIAPMSLPDLVAYVAIIAIVIYLWLH